jgi:hypothetical protein
MTDTDTDTETVDARCARLGLPTVSDKRRESLALAHADVDDVAFARLAKATRLARGSTIVLPAHHYQHLSRGRGWCRRGRGDGAVWGERVEKGYRVGPGRWTVGATDGFSRKDSDDWIVAHVTVGTATWTVAS